MNEHARALGKLAKGHPKHYTREELAKRAARLKKWNRDRNRPQRRRRAEQLEFGPDKYVNVKG